MDFQFQVLAGLPPYGEPAIPFGKSGMPMHSEGLVVEFRFSDGTGFVGNFQRGFTSYDLCAPHPDGQHVVVISGGDGHVFDPVSRKLTSTIGSAIYDSFRYPAKNAIVFNDQGILFTAIGPGGVLWHSRRISWDGFRSIQMIDTVLTGEAWRPYDEEWCPFRLDLDTRLVDGGSYPEELILSP